ncbi:TrbI/VirB10 family protein [Cognatiluteimonas profundi]|uniref:TrbI/VirB10 family protein n=1 Tax=Cognatiluteimonas profundi TaxID=2594501 RepID=UPI00131BF346|nr:TrbI/VirB10 family protein [Lysobacter profundi]
MTTIADRNRDDDSLRQDGLDASFHAERGAQAAHPDLDAGIPVLRALDHPRINRKALAFLGAIVVLLVLAAAWMFHGAAAGSPTSRARAETIVIPQLPSTPTMPAAASVPVPIAVEPLQASASPPLPPLPEQPMRPATTFPSGAAPAPPPTLMQRRMDVPDPGVGAQPANPYTQALLAGMPPPPGQAAAATPVVLADSSGAQFIRHPDALLVRGTYIRCVLETRIVTDIPGFTSCVVTEPTYSINGRNLLLPKGSKVSGRYDTDANGPRVAVVWDRITTPDGVDVGMASPGVDNLGGAGHPGDYDAHWSARIGAALMISMISDAFKYEGERHGPRTTTVSNGLVTQAPFESNTARTMERLANQALDRSISRPATVTINQGTVLNIYVAKDVDFSAVVTAR